MVAKDVWQSFVALRCFIQVRAAKFHTGVGNPFHHCIVPDKAGLALFAARFVRHKLAYGGPATNHTTGTVDR